MKNRNLKLLSVILCIIALCASILLCSCGENEAKNPTDTTEKPVTNPVTDPATEPETEPETEPVHEHNFGEWTAEIPATCTENGTKGYYFCASCGKYFDAEHNEIVDVAIAALGHAEVVEEETLATCTNEGKISYKCTVCGYSRTETLQILPHQFERTLVPPTCVSAGKTVDACSVCGKQNETIWSDINCDCSIRYLGQELIRNVDIYSVAVSGVVGNCFDEVESDDEEVGYITISNTIPNYHYEGLLYSGTLYKNDRGYSGTVYLPRGYNNVLKINILGIYGGGLIIYLQTNGERTDEKIAVDHTLSDWVIDKESTCTTSGEKHQDCIVCGETIKTEIIPEADHTFGEWQTVTEPSCTNGGIEIRTCAVCGAYDRRSVPASGHSFGEWVITKAVTCTENGSKEHTCSVCGILQKETFYSSGHQYGAWETVKPATCEDGYQERVCSVCGKVDKNVLPADYTVHIWGEDSCTVCGEHKASEGLQYELLDNGNIAVCGYTGSDTTVYLPSSFYGSVVTTISAEAFKNQNQITEIVVPKSITNVGSNAFSGCNNIQHITGTMSVVNSISKNKLKTVVINGGTSIGNYAFENCSSLTSIEIPNSVTSIGNYAFYYCSKLTSINYNGTKAQWNAISKGSGWNWSTGNYTIYCTDGNISK